MSEVAIGKIKQDYTYASMPPTRVCSVCGANEFKYAELYYTKDVFWLCPDCLNKLRNLIVRESNNDLS